MLCSLFLSGQMQTYWCPLWWLFVCASDTKVLSSFLMRRPGLHLQIFLKDIPGEKYHGKFFFGVLTNRLLLLKYLSCIYLILSNLSRKTSLYKYLPHLLDFFPHRQNGKQTSPKSINTTANYLFWKAFVHPFPSAVLPLKARTILQRSFPCQDVFSFHLSAFLSRRLRWKP